MKRFPYYLIARVGDDEACLELYSEMKELPATFTRGRIQEDLNVSINGPLHGLKSVLSAMDNETGRRYLIKLLSPPELNVSVTYAEKQEAIQLEVSSCKTVTDAAIDGLVTSYVVKVRVENSQGLSVSIGEWFALKMRHYHSSLTQVPQLSPKLLYRGYLRMKNALIGLHSLNLVHMDVKSDNVFVDEEGIWNLGDFGSARAPGSLCWTFTDVLNPYQLVQLKTKVNPSMDFVCLCVMIAVEMEKESWKTRLCGVHQKVQRDFIAQSLKGIEDMKFREDIVALLDKSYSIVLDTL
jgi:hypothetical protein